MATKLKFTAFEELMLQQDSVAFPCNIYARMLLTGQLDRPLFIKAIHAVCERHPLLKSRTEKRRGRHAWLVNNAASPTITWRHASAALSEENYPPESMFDLTREAGIALDVCHVLKDATDEDVCHDWSVSPDSDTTYLVSIKLHHAVADGLAVVQVLRDLLQTYDVLVRNQPIDVPSGTWESLAVRNRFVSSAFQVLKMIPSQLVGLAGVRQFLMRQPTPLLNRPLEKSSTVHSVPFCCETLSFAKHQFTALRNEAKRRSVTVNDLLATCIFRGLAGFRSSKEPLGPKEWVRMMVPVNMRRTTELQQLSACNCVSCVFLDRLPEQLNDFDTLLDSVHREMELIKTNRLEMLFSLSLWLRNKIPVSFNRPPTETRCQASLVFSNLGVVFSGDNSRDAEAKVIAGRLTLEKIETYAPLAMNMCVAITTLFYAGELQLMMRYDPQAITQTQSQELLNLVSLELQQILNPRAEKL